MLSDKDYREYLEQVLLIENTMTGVYKGHSERVDDRNLKIFFSRLSEEERQHAEIVLKIMDIMGVPKG